MRIISRKILRDFWSRHPDAQQSLQAWYNDARHAEWRSPADIKNVYRNASFLANNRVIFNIKGNHYRIVVAIQYSHGIIYIRFVGTHREYDKIDATTI
jgi:mRNA interferase HigB